MAGKKKEIESVPETVEIPYQETEVDGMETGTVEPLAVEVKESIQEKIVYIGPAKIGLSPGTVFLDGITTQAKKLINTVPIAKLLFVRLEDLSEARAQVFEKGTALNTAFQKTLKADI